MPHEHFDALNKIFIVSAGRTGTKFLGEKLPGVLPDCYGVHEPDNVWIARHHLFRPILRQLRAHGGFMNLILLKALGLTGARNHSLRRLSGKLDKDTFLKKLRAERRWLDTIPCSTYIEANQQLFGCGADLVSLPNTRVVLFVRNPISWTRSMMNLRQGLFSKNDLMTSINCFGFRRLTPGNIGQPFDGWDACGRIEKLAWLWNYVNGLLLEISRGGHENVRLLRFEDFFEDRDENTIRAFLLFVTSDPDLADKAFAVLTARMKTKVHSAYDGTSTWEFSKEEMATLERICGPLMKELGY